MRLRKFLPGALIALCATLSAMTPSQAQRASQNQAGDFDYYALVLSWSPSYCAAEGAGRNDPQCSSRRPYAFVLHGLWPQYTRGFPESCRTSFDPFVPRPVINRMLDIMPAPKLVIHEYRKHGTCSGLTPDAYFDTARKLYNKIRVPAAYQDLDRPLVTTTGEIVKAFVAANPGLKPDMMGVSCGRPNRMREIRICFSKEGELKSCGSNERQERLCRTNNVYMPPVRAGGERTVPPANRPVPAIGPADGQRKI